MGYALSPSGMLVHDRKDWPCAVCRPAAVLGRSGHCLCVQCAHSAMVAASAGVESARDLLEEITDALVLLDPQVHNNSSTAN